MKAQQVGFSETKTLVGDEQGVVIGWIVKVTHPKSTGGFHVMESKDPVPEDRVDWTLDQYRQAITDKLNRQRGFNDPNYHCYLDMSKVRAA